MTTDSKKLISVSVHGLTRAQFSANACFVTDTLQTAGFEAYIVGGGVRDLLLGLHPKDFDVATNAKPEEIKALFPSCILIGKRFRLAHIYFRNDMIEVATFRASHEEALDAHAASTREGIITRDNVYGNLQQDASRRDFTINALYFNPKDDSIIDYSQGYEDIQQHSLRLIGEPRLRYQEDPIRILRAFRFLTKLNFSLEEATAAPIPSMVHLIGKMPAARLFDEYSKLFLYGHGSSNFKILCQYDALQYLFPYTVAYIEHPMYRTLFLTALHNTDARVAEGKGVNPAFLISVFLWPYLQSKLQQDTDQANVYSNLHYQMAMTVSEQLRFTAMPRKFSLAIKEIWELQRPLENRKPRHIDRVFTHPRFRAAYDFLLLRTEVHEIPHASAEWWTEFQLLDPEQRAQTILDMRGKKKR